jgi:hypothetical protein
MELELAKLKKLSEKRAYAGLKGAWRKHGKLGDNVWQMPPHHTPHTKREATKEEKDDAAIKAKGLA